MKYFREFLDLIVGLTWFVGLMITNMMIDEPTQSIFPYVIPVLIITGKRNIRWGFIAAAVGACTAVISGAITGNANSGVSLAEEGLYSFAQLSAIAIGVVLGKITHRKINDRVSKH